MRSIAAVVLAAVLLVALLWLFQRRLIYLPDRSPVPPVADVLAGGTEVVLRTDDGLVLGAWYIPAALTPETSCAATFLVAPGNGGNRLGRVPLATALAADGSGVLLMDYRGYGGNPGSPSEAGVAADARAAYRYLTREAGVDAGQLVYFGESLGGAVLTALAVEHPPAAMMLRSPFTDLAAAAAVHYPVLPVRLLLRDRFAVVEPVGALTVPTTVIYGTADSIIPPEQSKRVAAAAGGQVDVIVVKGADHNDPVLVAGSQVIDAARRAAGHVRCPPGS